MVVLFGIVLRSHILQKLAVNGRPGRGTGWISLVSFTAMALSGYLLQVVANPTGLRGNALIDEARLLGIWSHTSH